VSSLTCLYLFNVFRNISNLFTIYPVDSWVTEEETKMYKGFYWRAKMFLNILDVKVLLRWPQLSLNASNFIIETRLLDSKLTL